MLCGSLVNRMKRQATDWEGISAMTHTQRTHVYTIQIALKMNCKKQQSHWEMSKRQKEIFPQRGDADEHTELLHITSHQGNANKSGYNEKRRHHQMLERM